MQENTDITKWMMDKGFPYPLKEAKVFKWYDLFETEVAYPNRIAIHLKPETNENLDQDSNIAWWIVDNMPPAKECGIYDDRPHLEDVILNIYITWEDLESLLEKG